MKDLNLTVVSIGVAIAFGLLSWVQQQKIAELQQPKARITQTIECQ